MRPLRPAAKRSQPPDAATLHSDDVLLTLTDAESVTRWRASQGRVCLIMPDTSSSTI